MKNISLAILTIVTFNLSAQKKKTNQSLDSIQKLDEVIISSSVILGNKFVAKNRTGSAFYLPAQELAKFNFSDINRVLRSVPGVTMYEEDGFGLRPNISLRGTSPERSAKITIMEDGVLAAPAPYSAPSAYYFPTIARMQAVEILKGSSQVQYGPFTTGGAINMVSTQIPSEFTGSVRGSYGSFNSNQFHAKVGDMKSNFGYMVEYLNYSSDGFKNLPSGKHTGFDKNDVVAKIQANLFPAARIKQRVEFKFQYSDEVGNETYLGLSEGEFNRNPFYRYPSSNNDKMTTDHTQYLLTHIVDFQQNLKLTTQLYRNNFARNWYKLNDVTVNGNKESLATILNNPFMYEDHYNVVKGTVNSEANTIALKANNRKYYAQGVQTKLDYHWYTDNAFHDLEVGLRFHYDEEDRFQWIDRYSISNTGDLTLTSEGVPGTDANRISSADAFAAYVTYKLKYNNWTFTPGIRYEDITLERLDYSGSDPDRNGTNISSRENHVNLFIPGMGVNYKFNNDFSIFSGIHKGFSPPGSEAGEKPEESVNYELGSRFRVGKFNGEVVAFYNDYSNLLGSDIAATGGTGSLDQFNAGEVDVNGLELLLNYNLAKIGSKVSIPLSFGYTFTNTEFKSSFGSDNDIWGEVAAGDELPYIPRHQFNIGLSLEHEKYQVNLNGRYNGEFRTRAGSGTIPLNELVASNFIVDLSGKYFFNQKLGVTFNVINLFDDIYAASRVPAGLRPGHPFGVYGGFEYRF